MKRHSAFLNHLLLSLPLATGLLCAVNNASAQTGEYVTIPFAFSANHQDLPAGPYKVELLSDRFLSLFNLKTAKTQVLMVRPEGGQVIESRGRLVFRRDGTQNHLMQVWIAGTSLHSELVGKPRLQRGMAKNNPPAGSTFAVAMK